MLPMEAVVIDEDRYPFKRLPSISVSKIDRFFFPPEAGYTTISDDKLSAGKLESRAVRRLFCVYGISLEICITVLADQFRICR